jgi:NAD(P)-dependent dehydrogenase (short-subunit alcohol dehydrogenase family)
MSALTGRVALVTGGANGIGQAAARRLLGRGARVVVADVDENSGHRLAAADGADFVYCDVRDREQVEGAVRHAVETHGGLDIAFLNAGVTTGCGLGDDFDLAAYRRTMAVNVDGVMFGLVAAIPAMRARGGGDIIVTASLAGLVGVDLDPIYSASKHAIVGLVRSLGPAHAGENIRINALCPGFTQTDLLQRMQELMAQASVPLLDVAEVVDGFDAILDSGRAGECWYVQPGRPSEPFRFRNLPGPRSPGVNAGPDGGSKRS